MSFSGVPTFSLSDGTKIPVLAWGNGTGDAKKTAIESGVTAVKAGIRHIDTAQGYENEKETGESLQQTGISKQEVFVTSKLSTEKGDPTNPGIPLEKLRESVQTTIKHLGFQPNLLLIHNPFVYPKGQLKEFWQILEDMKEKGELTSSLGISNFTPEDIKELMSFAKIKPVAHQLEYHPYVLSHIQPILDLHEKYSIRTESYGPLSPLLRHKTGGPIKPILERIAKRLSEETGEEVDAAAALLLWTRAKGVVAVTASGNEGRIKKLSQNQKLPDLSAAEVKEIEEAGRKIYFRAYDEHLKPDRFPTPDLPSDL